MASRAQTSLNLSLNYVRFANSATPFPRVCYPGGRRGILRAPCLGPGISFQDSIAFWSRHVPIFFRRVKGFIVVLFSTALSSALSPWIRFAQRRRRLEIPGSTSPRTVPRPKSCGLSKFFGHEEPRREVS